MFGLLSSKEWLYASICFIVGCLMFYDISLDDLLPYYVMMPTTLLGISSFYLFLRSISKEKEENKNQYKFN